MTTLAITPNWKNKTAKFKGTIAAGEHVAVSIANDDNYITDTTNLRLRVVDPANGKTLAQFPMPEEVLPLDALEDDGTGEAEETWDSDLTPLQCTLDLNTDRMLMAVPPAANVPLLFVLDAYEGATDEDEGEFTLYFKDMCEVTHWPRRVGEDEPTRLDDYKDLIEDFNTRLTTAEINVAAAEAAAVSAAGSAATAAAHAGNSETGAEAAMRAAQTYASNASTAKTAAETAQGKAEDAQAAAEAALPLDTTLSIEGKAADAKAVGDALAEKQGTISDLSAIRSGASAGATAYQKPQAGIPKSDLASAVQASLGKADTALQSHQDISHKADKSTTYTKSEVDAIVIALKNGRFITVEELPAVADAEAKAIYLVPRSTSETNNVYDEYIVVLDAWEKIGSTDIDLSGYYQKPSGGIPASDLASAVQTSLGKADTAVQPETGKGLFSGSYNDLTGKPTIPPAHDNTKADSAAVADAFDPEQTYDVGNVVMYNGMRYECIVAVETAGPWTGNANWFAVPVEAPLQTLQLALAAVESVIAAKQDALSAAQLANIAAVCASAAAFDATASYAAGDPVVYDGTLYVFTSAHSAGAWTGSDATAVDLLALIQALQGDLRYIINPTGVYQGKVDLLDRAINCVEVQAGDSDTFTLYLPAMGGDNRARDLLVRLDLSAWDGDLTKDVSNISFAPVSGETATFETEDGSLPTNELAVNLWSFTETAPGTWAVARKTLTAVTQGGA